MERFTLLGLATFVLFELLKLFLPEPLPTWGHPLTITGIAAGLFWLPNKILMIFGITGAVSILSYLFGNNKSPAADPGSRPERRSVGIPEL